MTIWSRVKKAFNVKRQLKRHRSGRRSYSMGENSRLLKDWPTTGTTADSDLYSYLRTLRTRSRHLAANNDYAKRFFNMLKQNVVGPTGIRLQAQARKDNGDFDKADNQYLENEWAKWGKVGVCTVDGRMSWADCQKLFIETVAKDGECLVRRLRGWDKNRYWYAIQFIEADLLDIQLNKTLNNGNKIRLGVEFDKWRRPVGYWLKKQSKYRGESVLSESFELYRGHDRVPADEILHCFIMERVNQSRGVPWMHTAARRLHMLGGYEESELVASRVAAAKMGFFKSESGDEYTGDDDDKDDPTATPVMDASPGTFEELPAGLDFVKWDPDHPVAAFESFVLGMLRGAASGLNVGYVNFANDLRSVNYSSIRQGELTERDAWKLIQNFVIEHFITTVWEDWLLMAITSGALNVPLKKFDKFNSILWRPRRWQWVDPLKEVNANEKAIQNGFKSPQEVVSETGGDFYDVIDQTSEAIKYAAKQGVKLTILENDKGVQNGQASQDN